MKKLLVILGFAFIICTLFAHFAENMPYTITQPDGSTYEAFITGDEYYRRVHDQNNYTMLVHPRTGYIVYAIPDGESIKESEYIVGQHNPSSLGISPGLFKKDPAIDQRRQEQQAYRGAGYRASPTGTFNNIVGFVRFSDQTEFPTTNNFTYYNNLFNSTIQQSLKDYYLEVSGGQLTIESYLYPPPNGSNHVVSLLVPNPRGYYSPYNDSTNTIGYQSDTQKFLRIDNLITGLVDLLESYVPSWLNLDTDGDGRMDSLTFIFRGGPDGWGDFFWPACWTWATDTLGSLNGVRVRNFIVQIESITNTSVLCHEEGHMIGFPDFYHYDTNEPWTSIRPVGRWDLMASDNAQHSLVYNKWKYGTWVAGIPMITPTDTPTTYTLDAIDQAAYAAYVIPSSNPDQFYFLEYRRQAGRYEVGIPASGLIVYRVITSFDGDPINGNANGPPDEVYVYRPGGVVDTNGVPNAANFDLTTGRIDFHNYTDPKPWLYVDNFTTPDGDLIITDVSVAGGPTISFVLRNSIPHYWTGELSHVWSSPGNWAQGTVPTINDEVIIPDSLANYPILAIGGANCKKLTIRPTAVLTVNSTLNVANDMIVYGELRLWANTGVVNVQGDIYLMNGSLCIDDYSITPNINVAGNMTFEPTSNLNLLGTTTTFTGSQPSYLINRSVNTRFGHLISDKTGSGYLEIPSTSLQGFTIRGNLTNNSNSTFYNNFSGNVTLGGNLTNHNATTGIIWNEGTLKMTGSNKTIHLTESNSYLNSLNIDTSSGQISLESDLDLLGNFTITNGVFTAGPNTIKVGGYWFNMAGPSFFNHANSRVIFNGVGDQYFQTSETFNILEVDKTSGSLRINSEPVNVYCDIYDWTAGSVRVHGGSFTAYSLADNGIKGTWYLRSGGTINLTNTGGWVDLGGHLDIEDGNFNVYGGTSMSYWPYGGNASLTMSGGTLRFVDQGIYIYNSPSHLFTENITGGTIETAWNFWANRGDFTPTGGIIRLIGSIDSQIYHLVGSNFFNLEIDKSSTRSEEVRSPLFTLDRLGERIEQQRSNTVTATSDLKLTGYFWIKNGIFIAPEIMNVAGNWANSVGPDGFVEGTRLVIFDGDDISYCWGETFHNLRLNKTGTSELIVAINPTYCNSYDWESGVLTVPSGSFTAYSLFDNGIAGNWNVHSLGIVNLHNDTGFVDLLGDLVISGGEFNVYGGTDLSFWPYSSDASITMSGGVLDFKDQGVFIYPYTYNTLTENITGGRIRTVGKFDIRRDDFTPSGGVLELYGSNDVDLYMISAANIYDLHINKSPIGREEEQRISIRTDRMGLNNRTERTNTVFALTDLYIHGSMLIETGVLEAPDIIFITGDWTNLVGADGFNEGYGEVVFTGSGHSNCYGEYFNVLTLEKSFFNYLIIPEGVTECNSYKYSTSELHITGGTFTAYDLYHQVMKGHFTISSGVINLNQASTDYLDLWGSITMSGGEMNLTGGDGTIYWPSEQGSAIINMSDGIIELYNHHLYINSETAFTLTENITGGTIRTTGSFFCDRGDFSPSGGTIYLHSVNDSYVNIESGSPFNVSVDKIAREDEDITIAESRRASRSMLATRNIDTRSNNVVLLGNFNCSGSLIIYNGTFKLNGYEADVGQNILVHDKILMNSLIELLISGGSIIWYDGSTAQISQGLIQCYGSWIVYEGADVVLPVTVQTHLKAYYGGVIRLLSPETQFGHLFINISGQTPIYTYTNDSTTPLIVAGNLNILGGNELRLEGETLVVEENININGTLNVQDKTVEIGQNKNINVYGGGAIKMLGTSEQSAQVTTNAGRYFFNVYAGGTISAEQTIFEYMNVDGINVMNGAIVDTDHSFHNCTFRNGIAEGTLLTINNNQIFQVDNAIFPANTWSGSFNVRKDLDQGSVTFNNASGAFSGESFEDDLYSRIDWVVLGYVDLEIIDTGLSTSTPYVGDTITISVTVANNGSMDIPNPVWLDFYFDLIDAPNPNMVGDLFVQVTSVPPGSPIVFPFEFEYFMAENWNSWIQIDTDNDVVEIDEFNNIYGPVEINWLPLPAIDDLSIQYSANSNAIQLLWSYPLPVDNFNIYRDEDPYFTPGIDNLIVRPVNTETSYYELVTGQMFFYRVTAERFPNTQRYRLPSRGENR